MHRPCFPPTVPRLGAPFPPPGPRRLGSPTSTVLWSAPIPCPPSRRAWLCFAWRYHDVRLSFAPAGPARVTDRPGVRDPVSNRNGIVESTGRPKFLGSLLAPMPCSSTPAGPAHQAVRCADAAPGLSTPKAPTGETLEAQ